MAKTRFITARGYFEYAKLFERNRDLKSTNPKVQKQLDKFDGQTSVNFYPANEEELQKIKDSGISEKLYGGSDRFKEGNPDLGVGVYLTLKRRFNHVVEYKDRETSEMKTVDFGGAPEVVWHGGDRSGEPFDTEVNIGNGTEGMVRFSVYGEDNDDGQTVRIEKVGVITLVEYEGGEGF